MSAVPSATPRMITASEAANMALDEALGEDPTVLVFGEDVADREGGGIVHATKGLSAKYGSLRVRSTPISEQAILGAAVGAAIAGMRPVAEIMLMNFLTVGMDQLINHAAKIRFMSGGQTAVPLTVRTMTGAGGGFGGQHSDMLEAWLAHVPGLKVVVPSNPTEWKGLLKACIFDDNPCVFIENTMMVITGAKSPCPEPGFRIELGKANVARVGSDVTIIGYGRPVGDALAVAEQLAGEGVSVEVVDLRTIAPLDMPTVLKSVAKTKRAVIVHEAVKSFGVGAEIATRINEELFGQLAAPVRRVASKNTPVPFSAPLEKAFLWSKEEIDSAVRSTLDRAVGRK
jgi:acetoin:2,6-dichlorophenolindophenol oxidoreductase subunit beta